MCSRFIPKKTIFNRQVSHPWLDDECFSAIQAKCLATSTDEFLDKQKLCAAVLSRKFQTYQESLKVCIRSLPRSSKVLWEPNRELLNRKTKCATVPPLKTKDGTWCLKPTENANLLAQTFQKKCRLPPGDWRPEREESRHAAMSDFHLVRCR